MSFYFRSPLPCEFLLSQPFSVIPSIPSWCRGGGRRGCTSMRFLSLLPCCSSNDINTIHSDDPAGPSKPVAKVGFSVLVSLHPYSPFPTQAPEEAKKLAAGKSEPYAPARSVALFETYADPDTPDVIGPEGLEKLCSDANIPMEGALPLLFSWQLGAQEMGKFTKDEWVEWTTARKYVCLFVPETPPLIPVQNIHTFSDIPGVGRPR